MLNQFKKINNIRYEMKLSLKHSENWNKDILKQFIHINSDRQVILKVH